MLLVQVMAIVEVLEGNWGLGEDVEVGPVGVEERMRRLQCIDKV